MPDMNFGNENTNDNNKEMAKMCLTFLERADLKGGEVNAFAACCNWLLNIVNVKPQSIVPLSVQPEDISGLERKNIIPEGNIPQ